MKKYFMLGMLLIGALSLTHANDKHQFIKEDYSYVTNYKLPDGTFYSGYMDENNKPCGIGQKSSKELYGSLVGDLALGMYKNGVPNGYFYEKDTYQGMMANGVPNGFGRKNGLSCQWNNGKYTNGICFYDNDFATIIVDGKTYKASQYFADKLYNNNKEKIKNEVAKAGVRFVEDEPLGPGMYSGGMKDGKPYAYGAYINQDADFTYVACGVVKECCQGPSQNITWGLYECWRQEKYTDQYYKKDIYNKKAYYQHFFLNENNDSVWIEETPTKYEKTIKNIHSQTIASDIIKLGERSSYYHFIKNDTKGEWGVSYDEYNGIMEGYVNNEGLYGFREIYTLSWNGERIKGDGRELYTITFPNGFQLVSLSNSYYAIKSQAGEYAIVLWERENDLRDYINKCNAKDKINPTTGYKFLRVYYDDGELKKELNKAYYESDANKIRTEIINNIEGKVKDFFNAPKQGNAKYTLANGNTFDGEWESYQPNGIGTMTYPSGESLNGIFVNGAPKGKGIMTFTTGESLETEWDGNTMAKEIILKTANGITYKGEQQYPHLNGNAQITYSDGSKYIGAYNEGRNGEGAYILPNGDKITTQWNNNNIPEGATVTYEWADGRKCIGTLTKGALKKPEYFTAEGEQAPKNVIKTWIVQLQPINEVVKFPETSMIK